MNRDLKYISNTEMHRRIKKYDVYDHHAESKRRFLPQDIVKVNQSTFAINRPKIVQKQQQTSFKTHELPNSQNVMRKERRLALAAVMRSNEQIAQQFDTQYVAVPIQSIRRWWKTLINVIGLAVFIFAVGVSVQTLLLNHQAKEQVAVLGEQITTDAQGVPEGSGDNPAEEAVDETAFWSYKPINPEHPRYLRIPELSVYARIKSLGLTEAGAVDAPANINDTGWYNKGAIPGSPTGSSLILGHVSGWTADGVFKKLTQLSEGSRFQVEKGSGEVLNYEVYKKQSFPVDQLDMQAILNPDTPGVHDLKLMTCGGKFDAARQTYLDRVVVYARQVK